MGAVFEAEHTLLEKRVAIKVMLPDRDPVVAEQMSARMVREARAASATGHRNITQVTDMGWVRKGSLFVVMEYLDGATLRDILDERGVFPVDRTAGLMSQVLAGLDVVHRKGIVHRDLKPENLMLVQDDEGQEVVKILDFGISKLLSDERKVNLTSTGLVIGTPQYMSPEQARNSAEIDRRTDIYSVGAIAYHLVTGTLPHQQETISALIAAVLTAPVDPPSKRRAGLPASLDAVLLRALSRDPRDRYPDARAFREALRPFVEPGPAWTEGTHARARAGASSSAPDTTSPTPPEGERSAESPAPPSLFPANLDASSLVALDETGAVGPKASEASGSGSSGSAPGRSGSHSGPDPARSGSPSGPAAASASRRAGASGGGGRRRDPFAPPDSEDEPIELGSPMTDDFHPARGSPGSGARPDAGVEVHGGRSNPAGLYDGQARRVGYPHVALLALGGLFLVAVVVWFAVMGRAEMALPAGQDAADYVEIRFNVTPSRARVQVDGVELTSNPLVLNRSTRQYMVTVRADGYWTQTVSFTPDSDRLFTIVLKRRRRSEQ